MNLKRNLTIIASVFIALMLVYSFWGCEAENPGEPLANTEPETFISEISPGVITKISWYGTDADGRVESFEYKWDDGEWVETASLSETFPIDDPTNPYAEFKFADLDDEKTFYVRAIDNANGKDASPATASMTPTTSKPETQITEGPEFGKTYGPDIRFKWAGVDKDGSVVGFEHTMDNLDSWTYVAAVDEGGTPFGERLFLELAPGAHIFYVRAVDDLGAKDLTPAQTPFTVSVGQTPFLVSTSPIVDGGGWFADVGVKFSWTIDVGYYGGQLPQGYATYAYDDSTGFGNDPDNMKIPWKPTLSYSLSGSEITPTDSLTGLHTFYLKVRDSQGKVSKLSISFSAAAFLPTKGILVVNGVKESTYGIEISEMYDSSGYWGSHDVSFWDLMGSSPTVSTMPTTAANALGDGPFDFIDGGSAVTPDILKDYSSVVWVGNNYQDDLPKWKLTPIYPYLLAGGNVILATRAGIDFFTPDLTSYLGISWRSTETTTVYPHIAPGLKDMTPFPHRTGGLSVTSYFSMGAFTNNDELSHYHADLPFPEGWYHNSAGTSTLLFYNDTDWSYVRGMSAWAHPNLVLGEKETPEFPLTGDAAKGNFVYIAGRNYGFSRTNAYDNFDYILTNFFGETN